MRRNLQKGFFLILVLVFLISGWGILIWNGRQSATFSTQQGELLRFHVLANSDSPADQQLKLAVRDAVIEYLSPYLKSAKNGVAARQIVTEQRDQISLITRQVLASHNSNYEVKVEFGNFEFPIKTYGNIVVPAGRYDAVRILLGRAEGQNWWCVLFPPLCFIDMTNAIATQTETGNAATPNNKIELRSKLLELWNSIDKK